MQPIHQSIQNTQKYTVYFTENLFTCENHLLQQIIHQSHGRSCPANILCVVDRGVYEWHPALHDMLTSYCQRYGTIMKLVCSPLIIDGGEQTKNDMANVTQIHEAINRYGICRHSYILAIGGGAMLDMAGYAAATAHRGVRLIRVPTTVLAQCDAGVGIKNSMNAFRKKNFLGTFAPPAAVLNDSHFLLTLSARDWHSGIAEAIKVALLKDPAFFDCIERDTERLVKRDVQAMSSLIYRCASLHLDHIATSGDPFETGASRPLDFGHWAAHKLEQLSHARLRHGEAVALGIALDTTYSYLTGLLPQADWQRILALLAAFGFATFVPELSQCCHNPCGTHCVLAGLYEFREHLGGDLTIPMLECIGKAVEINRVNEGIMIKSITLLSGYQPVRKVK